jgi:hypothetical protein
MVCMLVLVVGKSKKVKLGNWLRSHGIGSLVLVSLYIIFVYMRALSMFILGQFYLVYRVVEYNARIVSKTRVTHTKAKQHDETNVHVYLGTVPYTSKTTE